MTSVRVKGFQIFIDRHGRWRCYHRKTGSPIDLAKAPLGSAEFFAECARLTELARVTTPKRGIVISPKVGHPANYVIARSEIGILVFLRLPQPARSRTGQQYLFRNEELAREIRVKICED